MGSPAARPAIVLVEAAVHEEQHYHDAQARRDRDEGRSPRGVVRTPVGANRLGLRVVLSALLSDGRRVSAENSLGIGGPPRMRCSEVSELLDRMLGRDPRLHRPPRLSWDALTAALQGIGVGVTERELIAAPLQMRLEASAREALTLD